MTDPIIASQLRVDDDRDTDEGGGSKTAGLGGKEKPTTRKPSSDTDDPGTAKTGLGGQE